MCFRFNDRDSPYLFRDPLTKMIQAPDLELKELVAERPESAAGMLTLIQVQSAVFYAVSAELAKRKNGRRVS